MYWKNNLSGRVKQPQMKLVKPLAQRAAAHVASKTDAEEAYLAGYEPPPGALEGLGVEPGKLGKKNAAQ